MLFDFSGAVYSSPKVTLTHYASVIESKNINLGSDFSLFHSVNCDKTVTLQNKKSYKAL